MQVHKKGCHTFWSVDQTFERCGGFFLYLHSIDGESIYFYIVIYFNPYEVDFSPQQSVK